MKAIGIVVVAGFAAFGAYSKVQTNNVIGEFETLQAKACACTDASCGEEILADVTTLLESNKDARGDQAQLAKVEAVLESTFNCVMKTEPSEEKLLQFVGSMQRIGNE